MKQKIQVKGSLEGKSIDCEAYLHKGHSKGYTPITYKKLGVLGHNIGNNYNPHHLIVFKSKDKSLRYEIYRDGNFYPYYGKIEFINKELK